MKTKNVIALEDYIYEIPVEVFLGSKQQAINYLNKYHAVKYTENAFQNCEALTIEITSAKGGYTLFIWLPAFADNIQKYSVFMHEICHASSAILRLSGIRHGQKNDETFAYLASYLFKTLLFKIQEHNKNKGNRK